jgi:serine protease inhibitor
VSRSRLVSLLVVVSLAAGCAGTTPGPSPTPAAASATLAPSSPTPVPSSTPAPEPIAVARVELPRAPGTDEDATSAADAINAFAFDLHRALAKGDENLVFSPTSIAIALGMARAGARGETAAQMDKVLRDVASDENPNWLNALDQALASRSGTYPDDNGTNHELTLDVTNAYFAQRDFAFEEAFLEILATRFGAGVNLVDFIGDTEAARQLINAWAKERTRDRIPEVLKPGDVTGSTRLALVNAIYLKAPWHRPFLTEETATDSFTRPDGSTVDVPMMHSSPDVTCASGRGWRAADLPYLRGTLSMLVIVPDNLPAFEAALDPALLDTIDRAFTTQTDGASVSLPKFDFETRAELVGILSALGMPAAFNGADFSGISPGGGLAISKVVHQANISVDEKGTEAAAVTVVGMDVSGPPPITCTVDAKRPFLFAIRDHSTGAILFLGRVVDPS